jgi:hypothetical protein
MMLVMFVMMVLMLVGRLGRYRHGFHMVGNVHYLLLLSFLAEAFHELLVVFKIWAEEKIKLRL